MNQFGEIARSCWQEIPNHFGNVDNDIFIVMPNHVHGIIVIDLDMATEGTACRALVEFEGCAKRSETHHVEQFTTIGV